ncbi:MAG: hypothetical protein ACJ73N_01970, partial [Bryobacteraceae bacterium]
RNRGVDRELAAGISYLLERASDALCLGRPTLRTATALPRAETPSTRRLGCMCAAIPIRTQGQLSWQVTH